MIRLEDVGPLLAHLVAAIERFDDEARVRIAADEKTCARLAARLLAARTRSPESCVK